MRGKHTAEPEDGGRGRIIPAHAGQTTILTHQNTGITDHPRACGANNEYLLPELNRRGSSPRMRGKRRRALTRPTTLRIIPAHAGQTRCPATASMIPSDHPRACGANERDREDVGPVGGSSPRMRGKRLRNTAAGWRLRIIPAHAGQTAGHDGARCSRSDHPRACGANTPSISSTHP